MACLWWMCMKGLSCEMSALSSISICPGVSSTGQVSFPGFRCKDLPVLMSWGTLPRLQQGGTSVYHTISDLFGSAEGTDGCLVNERVILKQWYFWGGAGTQQETSQVKMRHCSRQSMNSKNLLYLKSSYLHYGSSYLWCLQTSFTTFKEDPERVHEFLVSTTCKIPLLLWLKT